jgi:bacillithiol system protein YtxJ
VSDLEEVSDRAGLDRLFERSAENPVWLFKHSLTCGTSSWALKRFRRFVEDRSAAEGGLPGVPALLAVQTARGVSDAVAELTGVRHESPQVLLIQSARVVWHASHWQITEKALEEAGRLVVGRVAG